jgi:hypothetical protein
MVDGNNVVEQAHEI